MVVSLFPVLDSWPWLCLSSNFSVGCSLSLLDDEDSISGLGLMVIYVNVMYTRKRRKKRKPETDDGMLEFYSCTYEDIISVVKCYIPIVSKLKFN